MSGSSLSAFTRRAGGGACDSDIPKVKSGSVQVKAGAPPSTLLLNVPWEAAHAISKMVLLLQTPQHV